MSAVAHEKMLLELTDLPTASGCEDRVVRWIERWAARRRWARLRRDRFGNLLLRHEADRSRRPILFTAHMDHPAFVVTAARDRLVEADFRGGVDDAYFVGSRVRLRDGGARPPRGRVVRIQRPASAHADKRATIEFTRPPGARPGDVLTWDLRASAIRAGKLRAPACDDLAGLAAALAAFETACRRRPRPPVRVLATRAEEIGFIGAMAACRGPLISAGARLIALECSKSFADSPLGGGPIVRVGDRTSTFDPDLTYGVAAVAAALGRADPTFRFQRRLMPGGTCEATAFQALGRVATCVCLPLENYHNMGRRSGARGRIAPEAIDVNDFHSMVKLLVAAAAGLKDASGATDLRRRLDHLYRKRRGVLK